MQTETYQVEGFRSVVLRQFGVLHISQGQQESLSVEADPEVLARLEPAVRDDTLHLSQKRKWWDAILDGLRVGFDRQKVTYHLVVKDLERLEIPGAALVRAGGLDSEKLSIVLGGAGDIQVDDLQARELVVVLRGAGAVKLNGRADSQTVTLTGVGSYSASELESRIARVTVSGAGKASVWATEQLETALRGVGSIEYRGSPAVTKSITGVGSIKQIEG